jgi:Golgi nucleoside diphosphatase
VRIAERQVIERGNGLSVKPGLSKQAPPHVADYLHPLLSFAKGLVPPDKHAKTSIYLQATAGLRLLSQSEQDALIDAVWETFKASPFHSDSKANVAVVSGQVEGANEWVTVNYLRGTLGVAADTGCFHPQEAPTKSNLTKGSATAVTLGMGGASTQIVFAPAAQDCPLQDPNTFFCVAFQDESHRFGLYAHSCTSLVVSRLASPDVLTRAHIDGSTDMTVAVPNACLFCC